MLDETEIPVPESEWHWFGMAGHFICARYCWFHLTTHVGPWLVSTVGMMLPSSELRTLYAKSRGNPITSRGDDAEAEYIRKFGFDEIGWGRKYETMVFPAGAPCVSPDCGCGVPVATSWREVDMRGYNTTQAAQAGHYEMCHKWSRIMQVDKQPEDETPCSGDAS